MNTFILEKEAEDSQAAVRATHTVSRFQVIKFR
jgi:hypothetical protein